MNNFKKVAILSRDDDGLTFEIDELINSFKRKNIEADIFYNSESILSYQPDCVFVTSPQEGKLTPYPTYGLINLPRDEYLELPRFLRNILTYDGYLTFSPRLAEMLRDVMFGARKLGTSIFNSDFFPASTTFKMPDKQTLSQQLIIFDPDFTKSRFKKTTYHLLEQFNNAKVVTFSIDNRTNYSDRFIVVSSIDELELVLQKYGIAVCLDGGDQQEQTINPAIIKLIASCVVTIVHGSDLLKKYFDDNLYYLPEKNYFNQLPDIIRGHIRSIVSNKDEALERVKKAHQIFLDLFAFDNQIDKFIKFHKKTLIDKGFVPNPDPLIEKSLPSVSYIMRTGGKHRPFLERTLNCLVAQNYPDLRVIFVTHVKVPFINEIIQQYPSIKFKVIESLKSRRSQAIRDGMAAVETDLFGLFDDDDEIFPNHIRMLVKTLQYQNNRDWRGEIGMVYSGSIHVDDSKPVFERVEFQDHKLVNRNEKRAIEHFRFYSSVLMSQHAWFMPNAWLARSSLIDEEVLEDPSLDTCEDLYFELQLAQKRHFAFSVEVTFIHHFHSLGNSTIDDSHKHLPDTQRMALRNFSRTFPSDTLYDTHYNIVGRRTSHDFNQKLYQDYFSPEFREESYNQFYPFRNISNKQLVSGVPQGLVVQRSLTTFGFLAIFLKGVRGINKFLKMDKYKKHYYLDKFKASLNEFGLMATIGRSFAFLSRGVGGNILYVPNKKNINNSLLLRVFETIKLLFSILNVKKKSK